MITIMKKLLFLSAVSVALIASACSSIGPGPVLVTGITVSPPTLTLTVGGASATVAANVTPGGATNKNVTWSASPSGIVSVSAAGVVTPLAAGSAVIRATAQDGSGVMGTCSVVVNPVILPPDGSSERPFLVSDEATLRKVGSNVDGWGLDKHYQQTANITLSATWTRIGDNISRFQGTYDGGGYSINNLTIPSTTDSYQGMFGDIGTLGVVRNVALINISCTYSQGRGGGIAGQNEGLIENCYVTGAIGGTGYIFGGIAGVNMSGSIKNCYTTCNVTSSGSLQSGIVGDNSGRIEYCYATGTISGSFRNGGIVGLNEASGTVYHCVALNTEVSSTIPAADVGRVVGLNDGGNLDDNFARNDMSLYRGGVHFSPSPLTLTSIHGEDALAPRTHGFSSGGWWPAFGYTTPSWNCADGRLPWLQTTTGVLFVGQDPQVL